MKVFKVTPKRIKRSNGANEIAEAYISKRNSVINNI